MANTFNWDDLPDAPVANKKVAMNSPKAEPVGFNWDDLPDAPAPQAPATVGQKAESALQGFGQAGTLGYLPHIQAAVEPVTDKIFSFFTGKDVEPSNKDYVQRRDENIRADVAKQKQAPGYYGAGQVAGTVLTPTPGAGLIKGAGVGAKLGRAALGGAISGAAYNPGDVEGKVSGPQIEERLQQGLIGGTTGAAAQGLGEGLSKVAGKWINKAPALKKAADTAAVVQAGVNTGQLDKILKKNEVPKIAKFLKDEGLTGAGKTFEDVYQGSQSILKQEGPRIGNIYSNVQKKLDDPKFIQSLKPDQVKTLAESHLSAPQMASELGNKFQAELKGMAGGKRALSAVNTELESLAELGDNPNITDLYQHRKSVDDLINFDQSVKDAPLVQKTLRKYRDFVQKKIEGRIEALDKVVGGDELKALKEANKRFSGASQVHEIAQKKFAREETKAAMGLLDRQAALGGLGLGLAGNVVQGDVSPEGLTKSVGLGLLSGVGSKYGRKYAPGIVAGGLNAATRLAEKDPTVLPTGLLKNALDFGLQKPELTGNVIDRIRRSGGFNNE